MSFLSELVSLGGMFQGLPGMLLSGLVIFFAVVRCGNTVCVRGEIVEFRGSLMHVFWHVFVGSPEISNRDKYSNYHLIESQETVLFTWEHRAIAG